MKVQKFRRGQIWWYEYNGTGYDGSVLGKTRPVIIVSNDAANAFSSCLIAVPCTTQEKKDMPTHLTIYLQGSRSTVLAENILSVNVNRLNDYIGTVDDEIMTEIDKILKVALGLVPSNEYIIEDTSTDSEIQTDTSIKENSIEVVNSNINLIDKPADGIKRRGRPGPSIDDMIRYINDYTNHDTDYMIKKYDIVSESACKLRAYRYRKILAGVN